MKRHRVLLSGYFGLDNLGDEAIFEAMVADFRSQNPELELTALVASPDRAQRLGVATVPRKHGPSILKAMSNCDLFVSGGGGLIQDSTGLGSVVYYLGLIRLAAWLGKPTFLYGQGFGPVRSSWGQRLCRWLSPSIRLATFRDQDSLDDFRKLAGPGVSAFVTADPALLLAPVPAKELSSLLTSCGLAGEISRLDGPTGSHPDSGPLVAVTVRPWPGFRLAEVAAALQQFHQEQHARYVLLALHPEQDLAVCRELQAQLQAPVHIADPAWQPAQVAGFLRCCDLIVGMRLHSLILAAGAQVPCIGLSYDPKVERFAVRAGALPLRLEDLTASELHKCLVHLLQGRHSMRKTMRPKVEAMVEAARRTTRAALALIESQAAAEGELTQS